MSSSGSEAWEKYFKGSDIKTTVKKPSHLLNMDNYSRLRELKDGDEIQVLKQNSYNDYKRGQSVYVRIIHNNSIGFFPFNNISKPITKKPGRESVARLNILAEDFINKGTNANEILPSGKEPVKVISNIQQIRDGVLDGLRKKGKKYPLVIEKFENYFDSGDYTKIDLSDISETHVNELGTYFGEILFGLLVLSGQTNGTINPNIFTGKKPKDVLVPTDPAFLGVDSFIRMNDGKLFPISSKYGVGAKASFFGNLLPKGIEYYSKIQNSRSIFSMIAKTAKQLNITADNLEKKRGAKEILYEFGIRNILGIPPSKVRNTYKVYTDLKGNKSNKETDIVLDAIKNYKGEIEGNQGINAIIDELPKSTTSFFSRSISMKLMKEKKSIDQMKEILAGKNFYQANLNDTKWKKGEVYFSLINTGEIELKIIGSKAAINDIDAKQGMINYELKYPR